MAFAIMRDLLIIFLGLMKQCGPKTLKFSEVFSESLAFSATAISLVCVEFTWACGETSGNSWPSQRRGQIVDS